MGTNPCAGRGSAARAEWWQTDAGGTESGDCDWARRSARWRSQPPAAVRQADEGAAACPLRVASLEGTRHGVRSRACRNDGHTVDALALAAEEGRGHATKCPGEALAAGDPGISEWGNPAGVIPRHPALTGRAPGELKHLSTPRKREDSRSSGERTGRSPNHGGVRACSALPSWG